MVSTDLVTRVIRPPYTPVTILVTDDKPDDTVLRDCVWTARGPERHAAGAACCSALAEAMDSRRIYHDYADYLGKIAGRQLAGF